MQSLRGKCLRRTKAARVKSDSGNRRLAPVRGWVSLPMLHPLPVPCCFLRRDTRALGVPVPPFSAAFARLPSLPIWLCWWELELPSSPLLPSLCCKRTCESCRRESEIAHNSAATGLFLPPGPAGSWSRI